MNVTYRCPACERTVSVDAPLDARQIPCPACQAVRTVPERPADVMPAVLHRQDQHPGVRRLGLQPGDRLDPVAVRQHHIQHDQVGRVPARLEDGVTHGSRLVHNLQVGFGLEHHPQPRADDAMVVDKEDPQPLVVLRHEAIMPNSGVR